jgi:hypothetical protein
VLSKPRPDNWCYFTTHIADLAPAAALAAADEQRAAPVIEIGFGECDRFVEAQNGSP